jgi:hypothetical protein
MPVFEFEGEFSSPNIFQTKSVALNIGETIVNAKIVINLAALSSTADFTWFLTADGGTTWEEASVNTLHAFSTTGNDLRMKVYGASGATITVRQADGTDYPLKVSYNE